MVLTCIGCGESSSSILKIIDGETPTTEDPATWSAVSLVRTNGDTFCSGTYIADQLIVTAAHCVTDLQKEDFTLRFGKEDFPVNEFRTYKPSLMNESNFDIAWVKFDGKPSLPFHPIEILNASFDLTSSSKMSIAGAGFTQYPCLEASKCETGLIHTTDAMLREFVSHGRLYSLLVMETKNAAGPCFGDSGGPAYVQLQGKWYLAGEFMGWDEILVPENLQSICDSGQGIYTFVGDYVRWIEESSHVSLNFDMTSNPRVPHLAEPSSFSQASTFSEWCRMSNHDDPAWSTVQRLIRMASKFRIKTDDASKARELFENCDIAERWVKAMVAFNGKLELTAYDSETMAFVGGIQDLRPLASLAGSGLRSLIITDGAYEDLSPLYELSDLIELEIRYNAAEKLVPFNLENFHKLEQFRFSGPGLSIDWDSLKELKTLRTVELSNLNLSTDIQLASPYLTDLTLNNIEGSGEIFIGSCPKLNTLWIGQTNVSFNATRLSELTSLGLRELAGPLSLVVDMPKLSHLSLMSVDLGNGIDLSLWQNLQDVLISDSSHFETLNVPSLPHVKTLKIFRNDLKVIRFKGSLPMLEILDISQNQITQLPSLEIFSALKEIHASYNEISGLASLPAQLTTINLSSNPLKDLGSLNGLHNLETLILDELRGEVDSLGLLESVDLPKLKILSLEDNSITNVKQLLHFINLEVLILNLNMIKDLAPLATLKHLSFIEAIGNSEKLVCPLNNGNCRFKIFQELSFLDQI